MAETIGPANTRVTFEVFDAFFFHGERALAGIPGAKLVGSTILAFDAFHADVRPKDSRIADTLSAIAVLRALAEALGSADP